MSERLASDPPVEGAAPRLDGSLARWLTPTSESRIERIACDQVHDRPWWRDEPLSEEEHEALRTSIATRGIVEPLLLRHRVRGGLEVVTGSRRLLVAQELGMARVPAIVRDLSDREAILVGAWSTVDRRHPGLGEIEGVAAMLVEAGLSDEEVRALAGARPAPSPERSATAPSAHVAPFLFRPMIRGHRGIAAFAPFLRVSVGVMPELPPHEAASALAVLDTVRPASIAS